MKLMFASDIHGSAKYCRAVLDKYNEESANKLILLGDILYHGPRNALPEQYEPAAVIQMLNEVKGNLLCVRGNCDSEVDQMVLQFPIMADYALLYLEGHMVFITHGHIFNEQNLPMFNNGDILIHGHTHVSAVKEHETYTYINPGSVSLPKEGTPKSYMTYEDGLFVIKDFDGNEVLRYSLLHQ